MEWIALAIVIALAIGSFIAAMQPHHAKNVMLNNNINRFLLGVMLSAISPMQIPFWFGWSTVLFTKNILLPKNSYYNIYIVGIGLGTLLGNCVFIFGGKWIVEKLNGNHSLMNWIIGGIFAATAVVYRRHRHRREADIARLRTRIAAGVHGRRATRWLLDAAAAAELPG